MKEKCMTNCNHNLVHHLSTRLDGLWRYEQFIKDAEAEGDAVCADMWRKFSEQDEQQIKELQNLIIEKSKTGKFK